MDCAPTIMTIKNLRKAWKHKRYGYSREQILILDDTPTTYQLNYGNSIPIRTWSGNESDKELERVKDILEYCIGIPDVRKRYYNR